MTVDQFKQKLAKPEKLNDVLNYLVCVSFIGFGVWIIFDLIENEFHHPDKGTQKYLILLFPLAFMVVGLYGFWRIPKDYQIGCINSLKPIDEKWEVVNDYLTQLKILSKKTDNNHIEFHYENRFLNGIVVNLYLDEDKILYNVRSARSGGSTGSGFIDFGLSTRAKRRLKKYIKDRL